MSWIKRLSAPILLIVLSSLIGLLLVEFALRVINANDSWERTRDANILRSIQYSYDVSQLYENDTPVVDYVRNQYGLRDSCKSPLEVDILTVGGSTTDQRYVSYSSTYQATLEKILKNSNEKFGCVTNAGVDGHSIYGHQFSFDHWFPLIPDLEPKIILLYVGINDANFLREGPTPGYDTQRGSVKSFLKSLEVVRALLPIYRLLKQKSENASAAYAGHTPKLYTNDDYKVNVRNEQTEFLANQNASAFRLRMENLLSEIHALGATPLCATQPHRFVKEIDGELMGVKNVLGEGFSGIDYDYSLRKLNEVIFDLCGSNTVDLYSHEFSNSDFYDGVHTTASGSEEIGRIIAEFVIDNYN
jgi:hypothetical protein